MYDENGDTIIVEKTKAGDFVVCNLSSVVLGNVDVNSDEDLAELKFKEQLNLNAILGIGLGEKEEAKA